MDFLDIELETGHPVYEGVAFEEAELEEFGDIIRMVEVSYGYKRRELYRAINKLEKELVENFWKIYTASYIIVIILVTLWILRWY